MENLDVFNQFMETLYKTSRLINTYESIPRNYGTDDELYMVEVHTLDMIGSNQRITISEIAMETDRTKSAVSQNVDKLIKKDLLIKHRNPNNSREMILELTEKGEIVYAHHKRLDEIEYGKQMKNLKEFSTEDFHTFIKIANGFNSGMKRALQGKDVLKQESSESNKLKGL